MEYTAKCFFTISLFLSFCLILACKSDDDNVSPKTEEEIQIERLSKTWIPGTVKRDGTDVTGEFPGFTLTFNQNKTYTSENGGAIIPASGTWKFASSNLNRMIRDDGIVMEVSVTATTMNLQFQIGSPGGRLTGTSGDYEFNLITQ